MACTLLGVGGTINNEIISLSEGEKYRTEDNQKNPGMQKHTRYLNKQGCLLQAHIPCEIKERCTL